MTIATPPRFRGIFRQDPDAKGVYSESAGIHRIEPIAVAVPVDPDDLSALVEWARTEQIPLIPRGSGSSMSGGAIGRGVIVDLSRWKEIDEHPGPLATIGVGPGAICADVAKVACAHRLRFPVSPSSAPFCTIGGMAATNAAGAHTLAFGAMRRWVTGLECQFMDGRRMWIRRGQPVTHAITGLASDRAMRTAFANARHVGVRKDSSGYGTAAFVDSGDLVDLLVGSEGTLAFFTRIELALSPRAGAEAGVMGVFASLESAADAAGRARDAGAVACELLDRTFLEFIGSVSGREVDPKTEAILLVDVEGDSSAAAAAGADLIANEFTGAGAIEIRIAASEREREALWSLRHAASPLLARLSEHLKSMQFIEDGAVPPHRLAEYIAGVRSALVRYGVRGVVFGHAGDAHVHVNALIDVRTPGWRAAMTGLYNEVVGLVASLGGTLSGEHGDGRLRTPQLRNVWSGESLEAFALVKRAFDPSGLLNPGVKVGPLSTDHQIKYDPELTPLSDRAARALAEVERSRGYSAFRLDLLG